MQTSLDHLTRFQVVAIDCDRFGYKPPLGVGRSANRHLSPRYQNRHGLLVIDQAKQASVIFRLVLPVRTTVTSPSAVFTTNVSPARVVIIPV